MYALRRNKVNRISAGESTRRDMQDAFRLYEEYCIMRNVPRYSIFRSSEIQEGRR